jgi:hypothetical protein
MGVIYNHLEKYEKACEYLEKSLKIRQKLFGEDHEDTAIIYYNIGKIYYNIEKYE